ncbi:hypothetical protein BC938DRAFT_473654 [Jimgerdemannia flammicorona]|uniref:Uncharacterized protein n=1 Tax=Jimgerdemannia flammicorona TaxID=994334 RepID=A0A433QT86_9FUNG|nr:hypothetical protein BC938DRAFT_473654 [Jimgerdemannia flammicorona]
MEKTPTTKEVPSPYHLPAVFPFSLIHRLDRVHFLHSDVDLDRATSTRATSAYVQPANQPAQPEACRAARAPRTLSRGLQCTELSSYHRRMCGKGKRHGPADGYGMVLRVAVRPSPSQRVEWVTGW